MGSFLDSITVEQLETDPYPVYARLRREAPVAFVPAVNSWLATRWDDVAAIGKDPDLYSAEDPNAPVCVAFGMPAIIHVDGDVHKALRDGIAPHYLPRKVAGYIDALVRPVAEDLVAKIGSNGSTDLMAEYFEPISVLSLARSFGVMDADVPTLRRWFQGLAQGAINFERDPDRAAVCAATRAEIEETLDPILTRLARESDGSPIAHMMHHGMSDGEVRAREFIMPSILVTLLGGMQEPGHGGGSTLIALLDNPDQLDEVRADMERMLPKAIQEGIRWMAPIGTQIRVPTRDTELGGVTVPKGQTIAAVVASASRDEARFADPDRFDIHRDEGGHASFGFGPHFCAGKWFANAQIEVALRVLLENTSEIHLDGSQPPVFRGWEFRAPTSLHVRLA
ncbi:cytochrome P450 [Microbaculum marinum]|uniref:Cytochrome P450 n=1 Tax=Microbaculum marinum TaxID=1764581 RepID=A0AAW9RZ52_9HYPH